MAIKDNKTVLIILAIVAAFLLIRSGGLGTQALVGTETMQRGAPNLVNPSSQFTLTYTAVGVSGGWGATIEDSVTGGCTFPSGDTTYKTVMLSEDGNTKSITMNAPAGEGTCSFSGDYQFYDEAQSFPIKVFGATDVGVCQPDCSQTAWDTQDPCATSMSDGCGGTCTRTVEQNTDADTDCSNTVDRTELGAYITKYLNDQITRTQMGQAITAYLGGII